MLVGERPVASVPIRGERGGGDLGDTDGRETL